MVYFVSGFSLVQDVGQHSSKDSGLWGKTLSPFAYMWGHQEVEMEQEVDLAYKSQNSFQVTSFT